MKKKYILTLMLILLFGSKTFALKPLDKKLQSYYFMAMYYLQAENLDKAVNFYDKCIKIEPNLVDAYYYKAHIFLAQGNKDKGMELLNYILTMKDKIFISVDVEDADVKGEIKEIQDEDKKKLAEEKKKKKIEEDKKKKELKEKQKKESLKENNKNTKENKSLVKTKTVSFIITDKNKIKIFLGEKDGIKIADNITLKVSDEKIIEEYFKEAKPVFNGKVILVKTFYSLVEVTGINFTETTSNPLSAEIIEKTK